MVVVLTTMFLWDVGDAYDDLISVWLNDNKIDDVKQFTDCTTLPFIYCIVIDNVFITL